MSAGPRLRVLGREYDVPDRYTLGEARTIKRFTGMTLDEFERADPSDPDVIAVLVFIVMRRENPAFSEADLDTIRLDEIEGVEAEPEAKTVPPTQPASEHGEPVSPNESDATTTRRSGSGSARSRAT